MFSDENTITDAVKAFMAIRNSQPYRFGGKWWVAQLKTGFSAYRTKKAAINNSTTDKIWRITL